MVPDITQTDQIEHLSHDGNLFHYVAQTLDTPGVDAAIAKAVTLQLVGTPTTNAAFETNTPGITHIAISSETKHNLPQFFQRVREAFPETAAHLNGTSTDQDSLIGTVDGDEFQPGPVLDEDVGFTIVEQANSLRTKTQKAFQQICNTGQYSVSDTGFYEIHDATSPVLFSFPPRFGEFHPERELRNQIQVEPELRDSIDLLIVNQTPERDLTGVGSMSADVVQETIRRARDVDPKFDPEAQDVIEDFVGDYAEYAEGRSGYIPEPSHIEQCVRQFARAHAGYQFLSFVQPEDAEIAADVVADVLETMELDGLVDWGSNYHRNGKAAQQARRHLILTTVQKYSNESVPVDELCEELSESDEVSEEAIQFEVNRLIDEGRLVEVKPGECIASQ